MPLRPLPGLRQLHPVHCGQLCGCGDGGFYRHYVPGLPYLLQAFRRDPAVGKSAGSQRHAEAVLAGGDGVKGKYSLFLGIFVVGIVDIVEVVWFLVIKKFLNLLEKF